MEHPLQLLEHLVVTKVLKSRIRTRVEGVAFLEGRITEVAIKASEVETKDLGLEITRVTDLVVRVTRVTTRIIKVASRVQNKDMVSAALVMVAMKVEDKALVRDMVATTAIQNRVMAVDKVSRSRE